MKGVKGCYLKQCAPADKNSAECRETLPIKAIQDDTPKGEQQPLAVFLRLIIAITNIAGVFGSSSSSIAASPKGGELVYQQCQQPGRHRRRVAQDVCPDKWS